jgi:glycerophosphoryl diester phosphodiesterase
MKTIQVIGHRGAAAVAPENTWESFEAALDAGVDAIETDVRATRDGVLVLMHDESLDRTTDGAGHVQETPWSVVHTLDAGAWFGEAFCGARVPRLYETLVRYGSH